MKERIHRLGPVLAMLCAALPACPVLSAPGIKPMLRPHAGPHGGTLVSVAGVASVEFVYDCATGRLAAHVLDAHGAPLPVRQAFLRVQVSYADVNGQPIDASAARFSLELRPAPRAAGEPTPREASQFGADSSDLRGVCHLVGTIESLQAGGTPLRDIPFRYPGP